VKSKPSQNAHPGPADTGAPPDAGVEPGGSAPPAARSRRPTLLIAAVLAASALILAGVAAWLFRGGPTTAPPATPTAGQAAPPQPSAVPGTGGLSPGPGSIVPADAIIFRWTPVRGAVRYEISVINVQGAVLAHLTVPGSEYMALWPKERPTPPPGHLIWRIEAFSAQSVITEGRPIPFQVR
jgi:hypothetical protein